MKNRFLYKDGKEFKDATVLETIEEDGTAYPTRVSFPIGDAKQLTQVGYYSDGDTSWVNEVGLELSNAQKVEVTKDTLKATLKKAENRMQRQRKKMTIHQILIKNLRQHLRQQRN